jgi:type IV pilus assembly protein PilN
MLVDINLLPQKETRKKALLYSIVIIIAILFFVLVALFFLRYSLHSDVENLSSQLQKKQELRAVLENNLTGYNVSDADEQLEAAVHWAEKYPIETVPVLDHLIELLPERGFFEEFNYGENGVITLNIQFDSSREAAYYLDRLETSDWITDAKIVKLETATINDTESGTITNDNSLPRYIGQFEIMLNKNLIKTELETDGAEASSEGRESE